MHNTLTDALKASQIATKQDIQLEIEKLRVNLMEELKNYKQNLTMKELKYTKNYA